MDYSIYFTKMVTTVQSQGMKLYLSKKQSITEYFGAQQEVVIFFLNNIFNYLKGNCALKNSFAIF